MANAPTFGDALNLTQGGLLSSVGFSLFNSTSGGNTGPILAGTMNIQVFDNTVPYAGGALSALPLLASATGNIDMTGDGGLGAGFFTTFTLDVSALNVTIPQNIFVTQQFTMTSGTSTRNGLVLFSAPTTGTSPANVYIKSAATAEGLYSFSNNPSQFGFSVSVVPEPCTMVLAGLGMAVAGWSRRRK